jgi:putative endonuclease
VESTLDIGYGGEDAAVAFLKEKGYGILDRNYRYRRAEIDIVACTGTLLVIVEVKTRTGSFYEALTDSISRTKINRIVLAAHHYVREHRLDLEVRFDIVQIIRKNGENVLIHLEDAFYFF